MDAVDAVPSGTLEERSGFAAGGVKELYKMGLCVPCATLCHRFKRMDKDASLDLPDILNLRLPSVSCRRSAAKVIVPR